MPTQVFTIAKVVGKGGKAIVRSTRGWAALRDSRRDGAEIDISTPRWPAACRRKIDAFGDLLREHATDLPVAFFAEYVDMDVLGSIPMLLKDCGLGAVAKDFVDVWADKYMLACYALPDGGRLRRAVQAARGRKRRSSSFTQEARWMLDVLQNAVTAWEDMAPEGAIVLLRRVVGPSVLDSEVIASRRALPAWCTNLDKAPPARSTRRGRSTPRRPG